MFYIFLIGVFMNKETILISSEAKRYIDMCQKNIDGFNSDEFVSNLIIDGISLYMRQKVGGLVANPLPKKEGEKSLTEVLFELRQDRYN